ncbi:hypothetical protein [Pengzhenrongella phosphoraccumulans]|jgi:hypothetical protein|uniref:hypothetical protein n=1 Tax=Pengzhenrongella phosphoraccumulans TaxID=3114394 RepID=UPI00388F0951
MIRAQWEWVLEDTSGRILDRPISPVFGNQFDAEQWLGENWRDLARQSVTVARLMHDGAAAAAPVALRLP